MMLSCCCPHYRATRKLQLGRGVEAEPPHWECRGCRRCLALHSCCTSSLRYEFLNQLHCIGCWFYSAEVGLRSACGLWEQICQCGCLPVCVCVCTLPVLVRCFIDIVQDRACVCVCVLHPQARLIMDAAQADFRVQIFVYERKTREVERMQERRKCRYVSDNQYVCLSGRLFCCQGISDVVAGP